MYPKIYISYLIILTIITLTISCNYNQENASTNKSKTNSLIKDSTSKVLRKSSVDSYKTNQINSNKSDERTISYINKNLAPGERDAPTSDFSLNVFAQNISTNSTEMYLVGYASGAGAMDHFIYRKKEDGYFYLMENLDYNTKLLNDSTNGAPDLLVHSKYPGIDHTYLKYKLEFNGNDYDTVSINNIPVEAYKKAGKPGFGYDVRMDTFQLTFRILSSKLRDSFELEFPVSKDQLFSIFIKKDEDGAYEFAGFLPSCPRKFNKVYSTHFDRTVLGKKYYPVFKTHTIIENNLRVNRLHYYNGERYIGKIQPLSSIQFHEKLQNDYKIEMVDSLGFEVLIR